MKNLQKVSLRQNAIFISNEELGKERKAMTPNMTVLVANAKRLGFAFSESLLQALNHTKPEVGEGILMVLKEVLGTNKNWTPLVKAWDIPTGETVVDHLVTFLHNFFNIKSETSLPCGHVIPPNTFPLERYNGCPFCGTPFEFGEIENYGQGSKLKVLELWTIKDLNHYFESLLTSKTALDATQIDSLKILLNHRPLPKVAIGMKETLMAVIDTLIEEGKAEEAQFLFKTPNDILRYLWYKKTGFLQIIEPKTILKKVASNNTHIQRDLSRDVVAKNSKKIDLKLKYDRSECRMVAKWLNNLPLSAEQACEIMHPKREMWVRFIRALRLAEYSKKRGFDKLAQLMDVFYHKKYTVWQGHVNHFRMKKNAEATFALLKQRPGLFARSLFANMLWFGPKQATDAFEEVIDKVPARLVFTLNMYAKNYFDPKQNRSVKPLGGTNKKIPVHPLVKLSKPGQLEYMKTRIERLCLTAMEKRFAAIENNNQTIFIDPSLYKMPVAIGDRSESVQDLPVALMGTRFPIEGDKVRLFMQWGVGLPAQHLDMDLSCMVAYDNRVEYCSYSQLTTTGCQHSGDILEIPNKVGTAEYIELDVYALEQAGAKYVSFTCNAYSNGSISPNLVVGWMNSKYPMKISKKSGVAYDPSCVQHQVRVTQTLSKGLVFGVLDVAAREVVWLEMSFAGQVVQNLNTKGVEALLSKLDSKLNIGRLLEIKATAQHLDHVMKAEADEVYDVQWAMNAAAVTGLLVD